MSEELRQMLADVKRAQEQRDALLDPEVREAVQEMRAEVNRKCMRELLYGPGNDKGPPERS